MRSLRFVGRGFYVGFLLLVHGLIWFVGWLGLLLSFRGKAARQAWFASRLATILVALGATFVKVGQIMSTRPDLFPPHIIKALTRLLTRGETTDEKRREYLETISVECDRQIDLVLNLLDLSRIEGGVYRLAMDKVDVAAVIELCVKSETSAAERRRHKLGIEPTIDVPPVHADPKALRRVLSNLIENAIKYTPDGGSIVLSAREDGEFVLISVADNGRGIPAEDLPVLFDKFHRGRPAPHSAAMRNATEEAAFLEDADVSGVGLGLYLGKTVMERMGGSISVETEVGRGSTFVLRLPVWKSDHEKLTGLENNNGEAPVGS